MSESLNNNNVLSDDKERGPNAPPSDNHQHQDNCFRTSVGKDIPNDGDVEAESTPKEKEERQQKGVKRFLGIILTVAAAFQISFSALIVKILKYHPCNLGVWRFAVMSFIPAAFIVHAVVWKKEKIFKGLWPFNNTSRCLILQAVVGANSILLVLLGLKHLNLADATVISTSAPIFVTLVAFLFLGEKCGVIPILTAFLALVGIGIISNPPLLTGAEELNENTLIGVASSFSSMLLLTIQYVAMRYIRTVHHALVNLCFALWGFMESLVLAYALGVLEVPASFQEAGLIVATAVLVYSSLTCLTAGRR